MVKLRREHRNEAVCDQHLLLKAARKKTFLLRISKEKAMVLSGRVITHLPDKLDFL